MLMSLFLVFLFILHILFIPCETKLAIRQLFTAH